MDSADKPVDQDIPFPAGGISSSDSLQLPSGYLIARADDEGITANTWSCFQVRIDAETGRLTRVVFTK